MSIELVDYPDELEIDVIVKLDIEMVKPLDYERYKELYNQVSQDYNYIKHIQKE